VPTELDHQQKTEINIRSETSIPITMHYPFYNIFHIKTNSTKEPPHSLFSLFYQCREMITTTLQNTSSKETKF